MVDIDRSAAGPACPALPFAFHKCTDSVFFDCCEVFEHAHVVFCPVARIELPESAAQETAALMGISVLHLFADRRSAALPVLVRCFRTAATPVLFPQEGTADGAVHATGCDQGSPEGICRCHAGMSVSIFY